MHLQYIIGPTITRIISYQLPVFARPAPLPEIPSRSGQWPRPMIPDHSYLSHRRTNHSAIPCRNPQILEGYCSIWCRRFRPVRPSFGCHLVDSNAYRVKSRFYGLSLLPCEQSSSAERKTSQSKSEIQIICLRSITCTTSWSIFRPCTRKLVLKLQIIWGWYRFFFLCMVVLKSTCVVIFQCAW